MKIVAIGDIHGRPVWRKAFEQYDQADQYVFLGDYVDGYGTSDEVVYMNLHNILQMKKKMPDKITLLVGNHDIQYLHYPFFRCSGFRPEMQEPLSTLFNSNRSLFGVAYQYGNYLFSHAGISNTWYEKEWEFLQENGLAANSSNLAEVLNSIENSPEFDRLHVAGAARGGGKGSVGGITWADRTETIADPLRGFHQVVGHTKGQDIIKVDFAPTLPNTSITYIDCLDTKIAFLELTL